MNDVNKKKRNKDFFIALIYMLILAVVVNIGVVLILGIPTFLLLKCPFLSEDLKYKLLIVFLLLFCLYLIINGIYKKKNKR